ncbi:tRNA (adenosine(37)-N6)-threonylcarbamoyltransferase complex ATPase subunit type 1 TsaE [Sulfurihydrogenibium sp.]|uniref:tRNA (adenosine(37)-N6)-threonylcarbamoyltransferase complex ATPase subunit type 1 TsaE n=1 Tax=Sulfurihydrogenibium sp. TaxID=2053621 RepID=UPI002616FDFB|nr:tRNA (adenosine(37)-N6)-threonylcarbamoyltransferase complex ATPase subunit type 1 TsaE [Sulfurihydrogenibium sp.]
MQEILIKDLKDLDEFAKSFAQRLKGDEIILLEGDLGAGKTTFTKFLLKYLGVKEDVTSPTFGIMNEYEGRDFNIYHIDMYRIDKFDLSDIIGKGLIIIEWPKEKIEYNNVYSIKIEPLENDERLFIVKGE